LGQKYESNDSSKYIVEYLNFRRKKSIRFNWNWFCCWPKVVRL